MDGRQLLYLGEEILQQIAADLDISQGAYGSRLVSLSQNHEKGGISVYVHDASHEDLKDGLISPAIVKPLVLDVGLSIPISGLCALSADEAIANDVESRVELFMLCSDSLMNLKTINTDTHSYLLSYYDEEYGNSVADYEYLDQHAIEHWFDSLEKYRIRFSDEPEDYYFDGLDEYYVFSSAYLIPVDLENVVHDGALFDTHLLLTSWSVLAPFDQAFSFMSEYLQQMRCYLS